MSEPESLHYRPEGEKAFGFAQTVRAGNTLYLAGMLAVDDDFVPQHAGDMAAQLQTIYQAISAVLARFDATLNNVCRETIYVTDMDVFLHANAERIAIYDGWNPAATAVEVKALAFSECMVEVEVTAVL